MDGLPNGSTGHRMIGREVLVSEAPHDVNVNISLFESRRPQLKGTK